MNPCDDAKVNTMPYPCWFAIFLTTVATTPAVVWTQSPGDTDSRLGTFVGPFEMTNHGVGGDVFIASATQLRLVNFEYDGTGPGKTWTTCAFQ